MRDTRGYWWGDYWGAVSIGYNQNLISNGPKTFADLLKPEYKGKVAINGSPLSSNSAESVVIPSALANGGSTSNLDPRVDLWAQMKASRNHNPLGATPPTVGSGQDATHL